MYSSNLAIDQGPVQVAKPESFPVLVMGRRWSFLTKKKRGPPDRIRLGSNDQVETYNRLPLPDDATDPAALSHG